MYSYVGLLEVIFDTLRQEYTSPELARLVKGHQNIVKYT